MRAFAPFILATTIVTLTDPGGRAVNVNVAEVTYFREPRDSDHFVKGAKCLVFLSDGRFISVAETCDEVENKFKG
jgi:hypothetical protein